MSLFDEIIEELSSGTYSTDDSTALAELQGKQSIKVCPLDAGHKLKLKSLLPDLEESLTNGSADATVVDFSGISTTIGTICKYALENLRSDVVLLRPDDPQTSTMINALVTAGILNQTHVAVINMLSQTVEYPFANVSLRELKQARGVANKQSVTWTGQRYLKINIPTDLPETVAPEITFTDSVITNEPLGKTKPVKLIGSYVLDLVDVKYKLSSGCTLTVNMWLDSDFTLQLQS